MDRLRSRLLGEALGLKDEARKAYGVEIVDLRLRRFNYPVQVREAIFARIRSEREKKAADYRSEGEQLAADIRSKAEAEATVIRAEARAQEQRLKGQADAEAYRIRNLAHGKDPQFYAFLKKLSEYEQILGDNKSVLLLSTHRDLFDLLLKPPTLPRMDNGSPASGDRGAPGKSGGQ
jgi:membrane protease subunit HflC